MVGIISHVLLAVASVFFVRVAMNRFEVHASVGFLVLVAAPIALVLAFLALCPFCMMWREELRRAPWFQVLTPVMNLAVVLGEAAVVLCVPTTR